MINYRIIAEAEDFYLNWGYEKINAPWIVSGDAYYTTKPSGAADVEVRTVRYWEEERPFEVRSSPLRGYLPASGEQSFVEMLLKGKPIEKAFCTTPCFRHEEYNEWHQPWFLKVELIITEVYGTYFNLVEDAEDFYSQYLNVDIVDTPEGCDIVSRKSQIELGSYGVRRYKDLAWHYGTGVAEPRLSQVIANELHNVPFSD